MKRFAFTEELPGVRRMREPEGVNIPPSLARLGLYFWLLMLADGLLHAAVSAPVIGILNAAGLHYSESPALKMTVSLYMNAVSIALTLAYCICFERRSLRSMGLTVRRMLPHYLGGLLLGFAMMSATVLTAWLGGGLRYAGTVPDVPALSMTALAGGWIIQGFAEELMFRGFCMFSALRHHKPRTAILLSAVFFAFAHIGNPGASVLALVNLALYGVCMALLILRTDSIWSAAALHSVWNWAQGNFFGLKVSGLDPGPTILRFDMLDGRALINGGAFGLEGGLGTTLTLAVVIALLLLWPAKGKKTEIA